MAQPHSKVCGLMLEWRNIFVCKHHCTCDCFFSIHLSSNSFLASMYCIYAKWYVHGIPCVILVSNIQWYSTVLSPFLLAFILFICMYVHYIHIELRAHTHTHNKKEFHSEIFGSVDLVFSRLAFFCCCCSYYLFILFSLFWCLPCLCKCMRKVYISASGKHHHLIWFSIKMYMFSPHNY